MWSSLFFVVAVVVFVVFVAVVVVFVVFVVLVVRFDQFVWSCSAATKSFRLPASPLLDDGGGGRWW